LTVSVRFTTSSATLQANPADIRLAARQKHSKAMVEAFRVCAEAQLTRIRARAICERLPL